MRVIRPAGLTCESKYYSKTYLAGSGKFEVAEIEVLRVSSHNPIN